MRIKKIVKQTKSFHTKTLQHIRIHSFSTTPGPILEFAENIIEKDSLEKSYINLLETVINYMDLKDNLDKPLYKSCSQIDLQLVEDARLQPIHVKRFCSDIRISANSSFNRNLLEVLLLPISNSVMITEKELYLSDDEDINFKNYKQFFTNDKIRESCLKYTYQVYLLDHGDIVTSHTSLKSFRENKTVKPVLKGWKEKSLSLKERHIFLAIFLETLSFEIIQSSRGKRSKSRIINYLIDRLAKSGV